MWAALEFAPSHVTILAAICEHCNFSSITAYIQLRCGALEMKPAGIWSSEWHIRSSWGSGRLSRGRKVTRIETSNIFYRFATIIKGPFLSGKYTLLSEEKQLGHITGTPGHREVRLVGPFKNDHEYRLARASSYRFELRPMNGNVVYGWVSCHPHFPKVVYASLTMSDPRCQVFIAWIAVLDFNAFSTKKM